MILKSKTNNNQPVQRKSKPTRLQNNQASGCQCRDKGIC